MLAAIKTLTTEGPVEEVTVPAGVFATRRVDSQAETIFGTTRATSWTNSQVPITAAVRVEADDGSRSELVSFGVSGATSVIATPPG
jgi:hypothetical protein